jgi:broad specificity phosphatase PhoE
MGPMKPENKIITYIVRHGSTQANAEHRFRGALDVPLDEEGEKDADNLATFFNGIQLGDAWTSDKQRAEKTADTILEPKGMSASPTPDLNAWDVGFLAGEKKDEHEDDIKYYQRNSNEPIPGGESLNEFRGRVRRPLLRAIHTGLSQGVPTLVVAHSSVIHELGNLIHHNHSVALVKPGGVVAVRFNGKAFSAKPLLKANRDSKEHIAS